MNLAESDKIITILTDKLGKIDVVVHGAKSHKSKFMASTQPFCYGEYILYKGKSLYTLSQSNINESFQSVLMDFDKLLYCSYMLELVDFLTEKDIKNVSLLALLLKTLYVVTQSDFDIELIKTIFEFKAISLGGYLPQVKFCIYCKTELSEGYFSIPSGGIVCYDCGKTNKYEYRLDKLDLKYLQIIRNLKLEDISKFNYDNKKFLHVQNIIQNYVLFHCDKHIKSLDMINKLNKGRSDL